MAGGLGLLLADSPPPDNTGPIVTAAIGAAGLILAGTVPVLIARGRRSDRPAHEGDHDPDDRVSVLEKFLAYRGFRVSKIVTGEESDAEVR